MAFKKGMGFEDRLMAHLEKVGYDVEQDETLNHQYKIDFGIRRFPQNPKHYSLGLQVTERCDDLDKLREFNAVHSNGFQVVDRVLYVEVESSDFERGVGHLLSTAISSFQFDSRFSGKQRCGVRVLSNMTYEFFDIDQKLKTVSAKQTTSSVLATKDLSAIQSPEANPIPPLKPSEISLVTEKLNQHLKGATASGPNPPAVQGFINAYYRTRDHGFISGQDGSSYFFRLFGVSDGKLRDRLLALPQQEWGAVVEGTVEFINAGKTIPTAKYPEAKNVRLVSA